MILDLIIVAIIILCIIMGYKKGLIEVAFRLISFILAIIISLMLYIPLSNYIIDNTEIDDKIKETIIANINPEDIKKDNDTKESSDNMPDIIADYINKTVQDMAETSKDNIVEILATNISVTAVKIISLLGIFIVTRIVLTVLKIVTNAIANLPIINSANKIGGIIYGVLEGLVIIYILLAIAMAISTITANTEILTIINQSNLGKMMFNNNILLKIIFP